MDRFYRTKAAYNAPLTTRFVFGCEAEAVGAVKGAEAEVDRGYA
jgi:hypothetical protein